MKKVIIGILIGIAIIVYDENDEEVAHYRFDDETGYALDTISGDVVDFLEGKAVEVNTTIQKYQIIDQLIVEKRKAETTTPEMCIKFEYQGFEEMFPIVFSGMDGKLDLTGFEQEVKDISVY